MKSGSLSVKSAKHQIIKEVIEYLKKRYGRTRLEKLDQLVSDWIMFKEDDFHDEDYLLQAMENSDEERRIESG